MNSCAVVLSTYNGEQFLPEQLDSLVNQTRRPDRIHIGDDGSTDGTVKLIGEYAENHPEISWNIQTNSRNKGWTRNFHDLIAGAEEDIIFLCDQDDVWDTQKIQTMMEIMAFRPEIELLACGYQAWYMDEESRISEKFSSNMEGTGKITQIPFDEKFLYVLRPGCTYCFRKAFFDLLQPWWNTELAHDSLLWRYAALRGTGYLLDLPLIRWRRYTNSSSSKNYQKPTGESAAVTRYRQVEDSLRAHILTLRGMQDYCRKNPQPAEKEAIIHQSLAFKEQYYDAVSTGSAARILRLSIRYRRFFLSGKTALADLVTVKKIPRRVLKNLSRGTEA